MTPFSFRQSIRRARIATTNHDSNKCDFNDNKATVTVYSTCTETGVMTDLVLKAAYALCIAFLASLALLVAIPQHVRKLIQLEHHHQGRSSGWSQATSITKAGPLSGGCLSPRTSKPTSCPTTKTKAEPSPAAIPGKRRAF